jgi:hypothetical protein
MEQSELLRYVCTVFERLEIKYLVTGSQATLVFGEPRFTNDIDIVADLRLDNLTAFVNAFPDEEFYLSREAAREAISRREMFNIIHPTSGLKIDVMIAAETPFDRARMNRGRQVQIAPDFVAMFASPDDVILKKMEFYKIAGSEKHLRDIAGVLKISGDKLDRNYIAQNAARAGVLDIWQRILHDLQEG